jgi:hypothetical protein
VEIQNVLGEEAKYPGEKTVGMGPDIDAAGFVGASQATLSEV